MSTTVDGRRTGNALAMVVGGTRLASGVSFLIAPARMNRLWGDDADLTPTAHLLLRSMGYRDALIGGGIVAATATDRDPTRWLLASAGADFVDLVGGLARHSEMPKQQVVRGLGGAVLGITLCGAGMLLLRRRTRTA